MADLFELSESIAAKEQADGFNSLTPAQQTFHAVWWFEAELNNGGFDQFFFNSAGDLSQQTLDGLRRIGAPKCADILQRACALFPGRMPPTDRDTRQDQLEVITDANEDAFESLDAEFYGYPDDIAGLLNAYWDSHDG
jgi:hypothetical protein